MNATSTGPARLKFLIRCWLFLFMAGLVVSGITAIPLLSEVNTLVRWTGADQLVATTASTGTPDWAVWLVRVQTSLQVAADGHPELFYGSDWLAFGHVVIALAFIGAWMDPVRNVWLFNFGLVSCALVIPWALLFGELRGIPVWWRMIDCAFGMIGAIPLFLCRRMTRKLAQSTAAGNAITP